MIINTLTIFSLLLHKFDSFFKFVLASLFIVSTTVIHAATPVVNTTITLEKTGSEPFDTGVSWTGDGPGGVDGGVNAGLDADENNNIVRLQDSITYRVEVSVNDSDVEDLTATVTLNEKQKWITIPTGCKTDPSEVGSEGISEIRNSDTELFCNMGPAIEGTTRVFFPAARAVGLDPLTGDVTRNDDIVTAGVVAEAVSVENGNSAPASDGPTSVVVTGFFRVDLQKELKSTAVDPDTGASLYSAPLKKGPTGRAGSIIEYTVLAEYVKGSLLADGDNDTTSGGSPGIASYRIIDVLTDDNEHNNTATLSTGAQLYTWDSLTPACELLGDHGAAASVTCTQLSAAIDDIGPGASVPDGLNDLVIQIDLDNIDVSDPDNDANLFEVRLNVWFDKVNDIDNHQTCNELNQPECINTTTNRVGFWDGSSTILDSFDETNDNAPTGNNPGIVSTEDSAGNHVDNYNDGEEPFPNEVSYPLTTSSPGSFVVHKAFTNLFPFADRKFPDQNMAAGETRPFLMNVYDYRLIDQAETQVCDKIDTQVFEYAGVAPPNQIGSPALYGWNQNQPWNPVVSTWDGAVGTTLADGSSLVNFLFSNHPYAADPITNQAGYLEELRTASCNDDINNDGFVVIQNEDGSLVDENGDTATGTNIDWWRNADDVPPVAGGAGADENVTRVRQNSIYDAALATAQDSTHKKFAVTVNHLITAKLITESPYGTNNRLPNFASYNRQEADGTYTGWTHVGANTVDPSADATFAIQSGTVDRMTLVPSSHSIEKYTEPRGIKVVRGGDTVDFIIEPAVFGLWDDTSVNTATIGDNLPNGTDYIANSEMFSSDGGTTWYTRAEWDARFNGGMEDVSVTSAAHAGGADPLSWVFGSLNSSGGNSDQLPLIKYSVYVDPARVSGTFVNIANINSGVIGGDAKEARYQLTILPEFGLDVLKSVDEAVYQTNTPFSFNLVYKNLGGEDYSGAEFIDILPYNGDAATTTGGISSTRDPESLFNGTYEVTSVSGSNGETFYATVTAPSNIEEDPCHASNLPNGYNPDVDGGVCNRYFDNNGSLPGGGSVGTNSTGWVQCSALSPLSCGALSNADITAIKFTVPTLAATDGGQTVTIEITPSGNKGGTPSLDAEGNVTDASTGDIYTNTFGGRIPEISLNVISNDVSVTVVSGSIGSVLWIDQDGSQTQEGIEDIIPNVTVNLLDGNGDPILIDPVTGLVVPAGTPDAIPYTVVTGTDGSYSFDNLPAGDYQVQVDTNDPDFPPNASQTYDTNGTGTDSISDVTLGAEVDPITGELTNVSSDMDQSFGYRQLSALGNYVWDDVNHDGIQDSGEIGIADVTVTLLDTSGDPVLSDPADPNSAPITTMTASDGSYSFTDLEPGTYSVSFSTFPEDFIPTLANVGDDTTDSDASAADQATSPVTLVAGETNNTLDLGLYLPATLSGRLWNDENNDGIQDSGEADVEGVTVTLLDGSGNPILDASNNPITTTTDEFGNYEFTGLVAGDYSVAFSNLPAGFETTKSGVGSDDAVDSNVGTDGKTTSVTLAAGETNDTLDAGIFLPATLGNYVWNDLNNDGIQDPTEEGIENVTVTLLDGSGDPILDENNDPITTTTDENGAYSFTGLAPGDYAVQFSDYPTDFEQTTVNAGADIGLDSDAGTDGKTAAVTLEPGDNNDTLDAGLYLPASLGNRVWNDLDRDGVQDAGEAGVANVLVTLLDGAGDPILDDANNPITTTTALDGSYLFTGLAPGTYSVGFSNFPAGFGLTLNDIGDDALDSDVGANGKTAPVILEPGDNNDTLDAGIYQPASLGNKVWNDLNNDGIQDAGEPGIAGVTVTLLDGSGNPILDTSGQEITVVTGSDGSYLFGGLIPGSYSVAFSDLPEDYGFTKANIETDDGVDSDAGTDGKTAAVTLTAGENNDTLDAGIFKPASIGDTVFYDKNNDGIIDAGEGLSGVTVELTKPDGTKVTLETDSNGNYLFEDLIGGAYTVEVIESTLPAALQGNNTVEPGSESDSTSTLVLGEGENNLDQDFGYYAPGSIGDTIWHDINDDGIVDPGEALADVTVELTQPDGSKITAVTDVDGKYLFSDLPEGDYTVEVVDSTLPDALQGNNIIDPDEDNDAKSTVSLGSGEDNTAQDFAYYIPSSIGDTIWHDKNNNGVVDPEEALEGITVTLTLPDDSTLTTETDENGNYLFEELPAGDYVVTVDETTLPADLQGNISVDPDGGSDSISAVTLNGEESNLDQDFAYVNLGSIGDTIWQDINYDGIADTDEGLPGITVTLLPPADIDLGNGPGVAIETVTLADGSYVFTELPAGEYEVSVNTDTLPTGLTNTVDPDGDLNSISTIELGEGEDNIDQDFAYADLGVITGNVSIDTDGDNIGDEPMSGVLMRLLDNEGNPVMDSEGNPITALTDELGNYSFANIIPGDYQVAQSQPVGYQSTTGEGQPDDLISAINVNGGETAVSNDFVERVVNPANIPTLSEWAMIFLVMMLGLISQREALARRRRY